MRAFVHFLLVAPLLAFADKPLSRPAPKSTINSEPKPVEDEGILVEKPALEMSDLPKVVEEETKGSEIQKREIFQSFGPTVSFDGDKFVRHLNLLSHDFAQLATVRKQSHQKKTEAEPEKESDPIAERLNMVSDSIQDFSDNLAERQDKAENDTRVPRQTRSRDNKLEGNRDRGARPPRPTIDRPIGDSFDNRRTGGSGDRSTDDNRFDNRRTSERTNRFEERPTGDGFDERRTGGSGDGTPEGNRIKGRNNRPKTPDREENLERERQRPEPEEFSFRPGPNNTRRPGPPPRRGPYNPRYYNNWRRPGVPRRYRDPYYANQCAYWRRYRPAWCNRFGY